MDIQKLKVDTGRFGLDEVTEVSFVRLVPAACALDLGDGSERGEYVNQDYILQRLGRPHRNIGLMYTYYPNDREWPARSSEAHPDMEVHGQWDYPYDDYYPYGGGIGGSLSAQPFEQMRDIRRHGQDVTLTLTTDCAITDEQIRAIARDLRTFGRMRLRVNHECAGTWFTHNRRYSYQEIGDFFVRFAKIVKQEAPNVDMIFCSGIVTPDGKLPKEEEFREAYRIADVWSADKYFALHFGWPFDICEKGDRSFMAEKLSEYLSNVDKTVRRLTEIGDGRQRPFSASEFNIDGDVTGPVAQGESLLRFADYMEMERPDWQYSLSVYQFRDRGRLGLEMEDPNCPEVGIEQPLMEDYKKVLRRPFFQPGIEKTETVFRAVGPEDPEPPVNDWLPGNLCNLGMRWGGAEDADGIEMKLTLEGMPVFFELACPKESNLMISVNDRWFYKRPGVTVIDAMPAFFGKDAKPVAEGDEIRILIFAPPADGENPETEEEDWATNYYTKLPELPRLRVRYEPCKMVE